MLEELEDNQLILNRYRFIEEAGSGGYATVQVAWDTRIQRRVAIKCLPLEDSASGTDSSLEARVDYSNVPGLEEARTAAMLKHPSIVSVYDFEVEGDTAYLIMEYVDGLTLTEVLHQAGDDMNVDMVTWVFQNIADALDYAHENQVLHLDIKPDNVLVDRKGQVFVTDFGLATLSGLRGYSPAEGGTIGYMPPEQVRQEPLDERCDEWALASLTYEMITGSNPFRAPSLDKAIEAVVEAEIALPSLCMEGISPEADDFIFYALDPERAERYESVASFQLDMMPCLGSAQEGKKQLAKLVQRAFQDEEEGTEEREPMNASQLGRLSPKAKDVVFRVWGAACAGAMGYAAMSNMAVLGGWTNTICLAAAVACVVASAILPHVGLTLTAIAFGACLCWNGAYLAGAALIVAAGAWWFTTGKKEDYSANAAFSPALFGCIGFGHVAPLLIGLRGKPMDALRSSLFAALLAFCLAGFGSASLQTWQIGVGAPTAQVYNDVLAGMLLNFETWIFLVTWVLCAMVTAAVASKGNRIWATLGIICGFAVLIAGGCAAMLMRTGGISWMPGAAYLFSAALVTLISIAVAVLLYPSK